MAGTQGRRLRVEPLEDRFLLAVLLVNSALDDTTGGDGLVTLREAIEAANFGGATDLGETADPGLDTIVFDPALNGATISLDHLLGELIVIDDLKIDAGPLAAGLTIDAGHGPDSTPNTSDGIRIFTINDADPSNLLDVELIHLTLTGGDWFDSGGAITNFENLDLVDSTITGNASLSNGGGILHGYGDLSVTNSTISDNYAQGNGGGIDVYRYSSLVSIVGSTISNNSATSSGGGIRHGYGDLSVTNSTISDNYAQGNGGGIDVYRYSSLVSIVGSAITGNASLSNGGGILHGYGDLSVTNSTISDNYAQGNGGGIDVYRYSSLVSIVGSTISNNSATSSGGGIHHSEGSNLEITQSTISGNSAVFGGGIYSDRSDLSVADSSITGNYASGNGGGINIYQYVSALTITGSTLSGNQADGDGGGLYSNAPLMSIKHSTITDNAADADNDGFGSGGGVFAFPSTVELHHTIVAVNIAGPGADSDVNGTTIGTFNLIGVDTGLVGITDGVGGNMVGTGPVPIDPLLGPLSLNSGPTKTHRLLPGSPALDAGDPLFSPPPAYDQRGAPFLRVDAVNATIDIGAYEAQLGLPGDYNQNNVVDAADYSTWRDTLTAAGTDLPNDPTPGTVDESDFLYWRNHFGESLGAGSGSGQAVQALHSEQHVSSVSNSDLVGAFAQSAPHEYASEQARESHGAGAPPSAAVPPGDELFASMASAVAQRSLRPDMATYVSSQGFARRQPFSAPNENSELLLVGLRLQSYSSESDAVRDEFSASASELASSTDEATDLALESLGSFDFEL